MRRAFFRRPFLYYITHVREIKPGRGFFPNKMNRENERIPKRAAWRMRLYSPVKAGVSPEWMAMATRRQTPRIIG